MVFGYVSWKQIDYFSVAFVLSKEYRTYDQHIDRKKIKAESDTEIYVDAHMVP